MRCVGMGLAVVLFAAATGCGSRSVRPESGPADVIASVQRALGTDRIQGAELHGRRMTIRLRPAGSAGEDAVSLWYAKLLAQEVADRLDRRIDVVEYAGVDPNGGPDRRIVPAERPPRLTSGACRNAADRLTAEAARVDQLGVLGGACAVVLRPADTVGFVADAGTLATLDLPGAPNSRPKLVEVVDASGTLQFVLWWVPGFGARIGSGAAWVKPGLQSSAILGVPHVETIP